MDMSRFFGKTSKAGKEPEPTLELAIGNYDKQIAGIDVDIEKSKAEVRAHLKAMNEMPNGLGKEYAKKQVRTMLKKQYELQARRDKVEKEVRNLQQVQMMKDNLAGVTMTLKVMKTTQRELRKEYGKINPDKIERMQDEMADLLDLSNEIQDTLSRGYDVPDDVDEDELDAELEMLSAQMESGGVGALDAGGVPDFLRDEVPEFVDEPPEASKVQEAAR